MRFLSIGECMAELSPEDQPGLFRLGFAGDTFNTAWYLARSGAAKNVSFFTCIGGDETSAQMRRAMCEGGISDDHVLEVPDRTVGLYLIALKDGERSFSYWRGQSAARLLAQDKPALDAACAAHDVIFFSGITLAILSPDDRATLLSALASARAAGKTVAFDPNLRPRLWADGEEMTKAVMQAAKVSDFVLPSHEDEATWFSDADTSATCRRYQEAGASRVIVKDGAGAVLFADGGESGEVSVKPVEKVVDTTAAGDSFNAGVFAGLAAGLGMADAIHEGCKLAAQVVQARGALVAV